MAASFLFPYNLSLQARKGVMLQFVTYNGFGNNLYIDNVVMGNRVNFDLAVTSFNNIQRDTTFLPGTNTYDVSPEITITNIGLYNGSESTKVFLRISEIGYMDSVTIPPLASGEISYAEFPVVTIPANQRITLTTYLSSTADSTEMNDTARQTSLFLTGASRNALLEEFTSSTSPSCGTNNLFLDTFINNNFNKISSIKYHVGFPPPGIDSMYLFDTVMVEERRAYYFSNSVPVSIINGRDRILLPYYVDSNLFIPYERGIEEGSPIELSVTSTQVAPDTIESVVNVNFLYPLLNNNLKLRVAAVERQVLYPNSIGASGDSVFYDVCRRMYPDANGYPLTGNTGSQQFVIRFHIDTLWKDTSIYTVAFIQSDVDRTVYNSAKSDTMIVNIQNVNIPMPKTAKPDFEYKYKPVRKLSTLSYSLALDDTVSYFNYENFEGLFLPKGWRINNIDGFLTYEKITGVNGVTLGGFSSVKMPFFDYANIGEKDTLFSVIFDSVSTYDTLTFDWAYAVYLSTFSDTLEVNISVDGGNTFTNIFRKGGYQLASANSTTLPFAPVNAQQWRTFRYSLSDVIPPDNSQNIIPGSFSLEQNYPNPFNPATTIGYRLPKNSFVSINIYDLTGRHMLTLVNENKPAGTHEISFNASSFSSGVYFYVLKAGDFTQARKLVFLK
ncbi:MAG: T9SS type A sorting domain-containing protein [Candidatus Kapaibacterium sp.]